jgi:CheY-like chemotaxis protein
MGDFLHALILALHEDDDHSFNVADSLEQSGHTVILCKNFADAITVLKQKHVDMIISDVHLQNGGNVFDFLRWVKKNPSTNKTPFVMLSAAPTDMAKYIEDGLRTSARLLGVSLYIAMDRFDSLEFSKQIDLLLSPDNGASELTTAEKGG